MKQLSLSNRILNYIRKQYPDWVNGGTLERLSLEAGYKASNGSRRAREMESGNLSNGKICPVTLIRKEEGGSVWYQATPPKETLQYKIEDGTIKIINKW